MITLFVWWCLCFFEPGAKEYELPCPLYPCLNLCAYLPILSTNPSTNINLHTLFLLFLSSFDSKFILIGHSKQCLQSRQTRSVLKLERYAQRLPHRACMEEACSYSWHLESPIAVRSALWVTVSFKALKKTSFFANFFPIPFKPAATNLIIQIFTWADDIQAWGMSCDFTHVIWVYNSPGITFSVWNRCSCSFL